MNIKDQANFIALQEQVIALLIKVNVMETFLIEKNLITADEYNKRMEAATASVASALKEVFEKAANQAKERQEKTETNVIPATDENKPEEIKKDPIGN